jgi:TonB family protein
LLLKEVAMSKVRAHAHLVAGALAVLLAGAAAASSVTLGTPDEKAGPSRPPRLLHKVNPEYPEDAKKERIEGPVRVEARVAKDGTVAEAMAKDGHRLLAEAAVAAVRQWRYEPMLGPDGTPAEMNLTLTINFVLDE